MTDLSLIQGQDVPEDMRSRWAALSDGSNALVLAVGTLPPWEFLGAQALTPTTSTGCALPIGTTIVVIKSETDETYYEINGSSASPSSGGYVPTGDGEVIGPLSNLEDLFVLSAAGTVHLQYFREVTP